MSWTAALRGDSDGFAAVFDCHRDRVYGYALRLTGNVHDAEDLTAGAFLELWRRRKSVRVVDGTVLPWLLVTTTNLARNRARGLRRYRALIDALPRSEDARGAGDVALEHIGEVVVAEQVRQVRALLTRPGGNRPWHLRGRGPHATSSRPSANGLGAGSLAGRRTRRHD
jgi:DNA-directed RNA polymerase specialized sigma24 family protein